MTSFSWKLAGEAGYGITTIGYAFTKLCARQGFHVYDYAEFPSLIRGGFTTHEVAMSLDPVTSLETRLDMLVALRQDGFDRDKHRLTANSLVIYDQDTVKVEGDFHAIPVPYHAIKQKHGAFQVMVNTVSVGVTFAILGWDFAHIKQMIEEDFAKKGAAIVEHNEALAKDGYDHIMQLRSQDVLLCAYLDTITKRVAPPPAKKSKLIFTGNDAFAYGSVMAQARAYCAYPMSPSSTVLATFAAWQPKTGMIVRHVEDEIAGVNQALGFAYAGVRSATGTSGGGFALKVEALSYAGVAEIPLVVFVAQRPGPATGLPTWTAQGDLLFAAHAGHGEFPKIILAPGDVWEMIELTTKAYDLADIYQTPVIVLSDKLLSESHESVDEAIVRDFQSRYVPNRGKIVTSTAQSPYLRYRDVPDGISELVIPGVQAGVHWQANSYEHREDTHTTEDAAEVIRQVAKRARKQAVYLRSHDHQLGDKYLGFEMPKYYGAPDADLVFVAWGSTKGVVLQAQAELFEQGIASGFYHFTHVYPLQSDKVREIFHPSKRYILVENNSEGQFGKLLAQETGIMLKEKILKCDGRPIWSHEIASYIHRT